ncbi:Zinc finger, CCHC-type [Gossypium australe]|uniref:Zinc finger, CCHC-type n=1 Tax=Gossypium australe TaxID=47621 RepID=A0A5B6UN39_9ROSI|nr:Zinc finger, CCHC-type [Gossypium australe]
MMTNGFKINECGKCVYVKTANIGYIILCLYVDDILIVGSNNKMVKCTKNMLNSRFDLKDMGLVDVILLHYVDKILGKFSKDDFDIAKTQMNTSQHLSKNKGESVDQVEYVKLIGSLMYLMSCTRSNITFTVSSLSRFTSNPRENHWKTIVRVLRYLRYTRATDCFIPEILLF